MNKTLKLFLCISLSVLMILSNFQTWATPYGLKVEQVSEQAADLSVTENETESTLFASNDENLIQGGDFENEVNPFSANVPAVSEIVIEEDGTNHYATLKGKASGEYWLGMFTNVEFENGGTYRFKVKYKNSGIYGIPSINTNAPCLNFWFYGDISALDGVTKFNLHNTEKHTHYISLKSGADWKSYSVDFTINKTGNYSNEGIYFYGNPTNKRITQFSIDDVELYKRAEIKYSSNSYTKLKDGATDPITDGGVFLDGTQTQLKWKVLDISQNDFPYEGTRTEVVLNTEYPWKDSNGNVYAAGDYVDLSEGSVTLTPNYTLEGNVYTVTFAGQDVQGLPDALEVLEGDTVDLTSVNNGIVCLAEGKRFNGWSATGKSAGFGDAGFYDKQITVTSDVTLTAVINYDYNFSLLSDTQINSLIKSDSTSKLTKDGDYLKFTSGQKDNSIRIQNLSIPMSDYSSINMVLDANYELDGVAKKYTQEFRSEGIYFSRKTEWDNASRRVTGTISDLFEENNSEFAILNFKMYENTEWSGKLNMIRFDMTEALINYRVRYIKFSESQPFEQTHIAITDIDVPVTGALPDVTYTEDTGITSESAVVWTPDNLIGGEFFNEDTSYTIKVSVNPKVASGKRFAENTTASINDLPADVHIDEFGTAHISYTFPKTAEFIKFSMTVSGAKTISRAGRYADYKVAFKDLSGNAVKLPVGTVEWSVDDSTIAQINDNGRLLPYANTKTDASGNDIPLIVTARSHYNPNITASFGVVITNQYEPVMIEYHTGMPEDVEVSGMPENVDSASGPYTLSTTPPVCEGYAFGGWAISDSSAEAVEIIQAVPHNADRTVVVGGEEKAVIDVYAIWLKGVFFEFNSQDDTSSFVTSSGATLLQDGYLSFTTSSNDPAIVLRNFPEMEAKDFYELRYRVRYDYDWAVQSKMVLYFSTDKDTVINENKTIKTEFKSINSQNEWESYAFDLRTSSLWKDTVKTLRFDPFSCPGQIDIDYIRFLNSNRTVTLIDGENVVTSLDTKIGETFTVPSSVAMSKDGYKLAGWSKYPESSSKHTTVIKSKYTVVNDTKLYAVWCQTLDASEQLEISPHEESILIKVNKNQKNVEFFFTDDNGEQQSIKSEVYPSGYAVVDLRSIDYPIVDGVFDEVTKSNTIEAMLLNYDSAFEIASYCEPPSNSNTSGNGGGYDRKEYPIIEVVEFDSDEHKRVFEETEKEGNVLFNFDEDYETHLFKTTCRMEFDSNKESVISYKAIGYTPGKNDKPALSTCQIRLDAGKHPYIVVKAKHTGLTNTELRVYYTSKEAFAETDYVAANLQDDYSMLVFDMTQNETYTGNIRYLSFSTADDVKGTLDIDWILFTDTVPENMEEMGGYSPRFPVVNNGEMPFVDVENDKWYYSEVQQAYKLGLVTGVTQFTYEPLKDVSLAEAISLAVRLNATYNKQKAPSPAEDAVWYEPFVQAAVQASIITEGQFDDYTRPATRKEVALIMSKVLPYDMYKKINMFETVPDMQPADAGYDDVLKLYNAGILTGSDSEYNFLPDTYITRAEMAAVVNRVAYEKARKRIVTEFERESLKKRYTARDIMTAAVLVNGENDYLTLTDDLATGKGVAAFSGRFDPYVELSQVFGILNGKEITKITVGLKCNAHNADIRGIIYFKTPEENFWTEEFKLMPTITGVSEDGIVELVYNTQDNDAFKNYITEIRFDPVDSSHEFGISYIILE